MPYFLQSLLLLLGPTMLAASIYMSLGRLIKSLEADSYSLVPIEFLTKTFVIGDVISFLAQSAGNLELYPLALAVMLTSDKHRRRYAGQSQVQG